MTAVGGLWSGVILGLVPRIFWAELREEILGTRPRMTRMVGEEREVW
jgi:hypothetical protein